MIITLWKKWREPILYLIFGVLTTLVNLVVFKLCGLILGDGAYLLSNVIAWCVAVVFAFFVNKLWVFDSKSFALSSTISRSTDFVSMPQIIHCRTCSCSVNTISTVFLAL